MRGAGRLLREGDVDFAEESVRDCGEPRAKAGHGIRVAGRHRMDEVGPAGGCDVLTWFECLVFQEAGPRGDIVVARSGEEHRFHQADGQHCPLQLA